MSEKNENKIISESEIKTVEAEIAARQAEELKKLGESKAAEIEAKVKAEYEAKEKERLINDRLAKIESENKKLKEESEKLLKEQEAKIKAQEDAFKAKLEEITSVKKGITTNNSPFRGDTNPENIRIINGIEVDITKLNNKEIESLSGERFKDKHRLPSFYFDGR